MSKINWGKPEIEIGALGENDAAPTSWIKVDNPVKNTTNLETTEGEVQYAEGEGGEVVDVKKEADRYTFNFTLFKKKGQQWPVQDKDGKVAGFYAMRLTPEDPTNEGIQFAKSVMTAGKTYTVADGERREYKMHVINAATGDTINPYTKGAGA